MEQELIFTNDVGAAVDGLVDRRRPASTVIITDTNCRRLVLPLLQAGSRTVAGAARVITMDSGEEAKNLATLEKVWRALAEAEVTRKSLVINIGGGVVSDLGGFAAATFKRGVPCINVPTTLLSAVDASVGGKTAINFNGVKNQLGTFTDPVASVISTVYLGTLPQQEMLSGYAEMLKHALLDSAAAFASLLKYAPADHRTYDAAGLLPLLEKSVGVKRRIVREDPHEKGLRKVLNLGHTAGHAIEAFAMKHGGTPVPHGYAVARGLVIELVLSHIRLGFPADTLRQLAAFIYENYGASDISCKDYGELIGYMRADKKNAGPDRINFTLLRAIGDARIDCVATADEIGAALDIYRDLMHLI